jgi:hypothetical protein
MLAEFAQYFRGTLYQVKDGVGGLFGDGKFRHVKLDDGWRFVPSKTQAGRILTHFIKREIKLMQKQPNLRLEETEALYQYQCPQVAFEESPNKAARSKKNDSAIFKKASIVAKHSLTSRPDLVIKIKAQVIADNIPMPSGGKDYGHGCLAMSKFLVAVAQKEADLKLRLSSRNTSLIDRNGRAKHEWSLVR